ncbi:hypothetical protein KQX54_017156 [Cotesia glomerata]|uniref:Uncharacterized protein n=1 Tax=Cotesia glomerata TaxID=32391 RepID=A0AAV7HY03_COTGL|nr:hypothetical protein KQX54_017156 [Cotesia glomerata]
MHASFPYDGSRGSAGAGVTGGRGVEYGVRRPDALLPPHGLDQTDLVLNSSLVDDPQVSDDNTNVDDGGFMNDLPLLKRCKSHSQQLTDQSDIRTESYDISEP